MAETKSYPALEDVLLAAVRGELYQAHFAFVGEVVSYDEARQVANVQPVVRARRADLDGGSVSYKLPQLADVPVAFPQGGGFAITFPLAAGSQGLVVVCERSHDEWRAVGGSDVTPQLRRRFDLSDAIFYPGVSSPADPLGSVAVDSGAMVLSGPAVKIGSSGASHAFVFGDAAKTLLNGHVHLTPVGMSGPMLEGATFLAAPLDNPLSASYPHLSTKIEGE